jgi:hypothetical protein
MTPIEIAAVTIALVLAVLLLMLIVVSFWEFLEWFRRRQRQNWLQQDVELVNVHLTASREKVLVGQTTDIRFHFTIRNPRRIGLAYEATLDIAEHAQVQQRNPSFHQDSLGTVVLRPGCKWTAPGTKPVEATVTVDIMGVKMVGFIQGVVLVVSEMD